MNPFREPIMAGAPRFIEFRVPPELALAGPDEMILWALHGLQPDIPHPCFNASVGKMELAMGSHPWVY